MKNISLIVFGILSFFSTGQKSIYFSTPLPSANDKVVNVDPQHFGTYEAEGDYRKFVFSETGITVVSVSVSSITKELVRESSKYDVRDNYIFGVVDNDSLPCIFEDGRYYFGVKNEDQLVGEGSKNILTEIGPGKYVVNLYEDGKYIPMKIEFRRGQCMIEYFDYEDDSDLFDYIQNKETVDSDNFELIILSPNQKEAEKLLSKDIFNDNRTLVKI